MKASKDIDSYIASYPRKTQVLLKKMRAVICKAAPQATEAISYGVPTYKLNGNLVHFGGFKSHIGFFHLQARSRSANNKDSCQCLLSRVKRTSIAGNPMSAFDPKRTFHADLACWMAAPASDNLLSSSKTLVGVQVRGVARPQRVLRPLPKAAPYQKSGHKVAKLTDWPWLICPTSIIHGG
jgi:hypothetical protein